MDMLDEKREEIQNIIRKRQRKAALISLNKKSDALGLPTMTGMIQRSDKVKDSLLLPEIGAGGAASKIANETEYKEPGQKSGGKILVRKLSTM